MIKKLIYFFIILILTTTGYKAMADPTSFQPQSTNQLPGDTSPDTYRVLYRGYFAVGNSNYTLTGSWYQYTKTINLGQFNGSGVPMIEFYVHDLDDPTGQTYKCPTLIVSAAGVTNYNYSAYVTLGPPKAVDNSMKLVITIGGISNHAYSVYYQVMSLPSSGLQFPTVSS